MICKFGIWESVVFKFFKKVWKKRLCNFAEMWNSADISYQKKSIYIGYGPEIKSDRKM